MEEELKYSKDGLVAFRDSDHSYRFTQDGPNYKKDEKLISTTTIIHTYVPPFDPDGQILAAYAKSNGLTEEQVRIYWEVENKISTVYGSMVHLALENYVFGKPYELKSKYSWIIEEFKKIQFVGKLYPERLLYNAKYKISGQADLIELIKDPYTGKVYGKIWDYKSNKELEKGNPYGSYLKGDLFYLNDNNFTHYEIQLSIYKRLFELGGLEIRDLNIIFINRWTKQLEIHPCRYMEKEVDIIFNNRLKELENKQIKINI